MDRYMSDHKDRMEHREVEGLVEHVQWLLPAPHYKLNESGKAVLRAKIEAYGAKEREAGDAAGYERGREEERKAAEKPLREALEEAYTFGFKAAKERAVAIAKKHLSPQTDVTK